MKDTRKNTTKHDTAKVIVDDFRGSIVHYIAALGAAQQAKESPDANALTKSGETLRSRPKSPPSLTP